jgi:hypothetical protein
VPKNHHATLDTERIAAADSMLNTPNTGILY